MNFLITAAIVGMETTIKDSKKIEQDAVNAVRLCFRGVNRVSADILENDKTPCIDGNIALYSGNTMSVKTLVGDIDIQVKGTVKNKKPGKAKRSVSVENLKYYRTHGGILYFVVFESNSCDTVYYKLLLPFDINRILRDYPNQKSITLRFDLFPTDPNEVLRLITRAIRDKESQQAGAAWGYCSKDEYEKNGLNFSKCESLC